MPSEPSARARSPRGAGSASPRRTQASDDEPARGSGRLEPALQPLGLPGQRRQRGDLTGEDEGPGRVAGLAALHHECRGLPALDLQAGDRGRLALAAEQLAARLGDAPPQQRGDGGLARRPAGGCPAARLPACGPARAGRAGRRGRRGTARRRGAQRRAGAPPGRRAEPAPGRRPTATASSPGEAASGPRRPRGGNRREGGEERLLPVEGRPRGRQGRVETGRVVRPLPAQLGGPLGPRGGEVDPVAREEELERGAGRLEEAHGVGGEPELDEDGLGRREGPQGRDDGRAPGDPPAPSS